MLSLLLMPSCWGKNPRTNQVGMDLETSSPHFVVKRSLFRPCPVMFWKASSDRDSATSMERLSQSFLIFTMEKNSCIKVKPLLVQLVPAAPCLHNVAPCAGRASIPSGAAAQSGHCEQLTPQGKRVASNLPKITSFPSSFSPESVKANVCIRSRNSAWWHSLPSPEQGKCSRG